jgi:translation initiation factor 3 subunit J
MAPNKWDDEDSDESTPASSPPPAQRRGKFDDEEEDSDVLDSWEAAEDSEAEREKAKKAAEAKAKADAAAKAAHKSRAARIAEHKEINQRRKQEAGDDESSEDEDDSSRRARLRKEQKDADLRHAEDLFGDLNIVGNRATSKHVTIQDTADPTNAIDLSALPLFNPQTKDQFLRLRETLTPLIEANSKKAQYVLFMQEFTKQICRDLPSDQIKKIASGLTTLSNEKMKEEKAAEKGGKKSKAAKTKTSLNANRDTSAKADLHAYDDGLEEDDFM